jgi:CRISPR-associated protein Cas5t
MLGVYVTVPIACFRKGLAREYLETEPLPPPSTCYGFLLSLVGEERRRRHVGCHVTAVLLNEPEQSVVLRTVWRVKEDNYYIDPTGKHHVVPSDKKQRRQFEAWVRHQGWPRPEYSHGLGCGANLRPDFQQLLSPVELVVWLDSTGESQGGETLEARVGRALQHPETVARFGGLSLGESAHLIDELQALDRYLAGKAHARRRPICGRVFLVAERGRLTLPVWVDHVGSSGTRYVTGNLVPDWPTERSPDIQQMPQVAP